MDETTFEETMKSIVSALRERGYNPYAQLYGYVFENEPSYITSYKDARSLIQTLDRERVKQFVLDMKSSEF